MTDGAAVAGSGLLRTGDRSRSVGLVSSSPSILVPSVPRRLKITGRMAEDFLCDPVLGVEVIFKIKLDAFQASALRTLWWVPDVLDSSGFGTGKSLRVWLFANLRCCLIEDQWGWIYYQTFEAGKQIFWPYYQQFNERTAPIFAAQLGRLTSSGDTEGKDNRKGPAAYIQDFKNGGKIVLPAPGWFTGARSQAGLTFNFTEVDEWTKAEAMKPEDNSDMVGGIDQQVVGRVRRQNFNQFHPLWGNHRIYTATAESPQHPAYKRYRMFEREIAKGNPNYAIIRYDFKDFSNLKSWTGKPFKVQVPDWKTIQNHKNMYSQTQSEHEDHGLWTRETAGWYSEASLQDCVKAGVAAGTEVETFKRESLKAPESLSEEIYYFCGADPAPAKTKRADDGALAVLRARPRQDLGHPATNNLGDWLTEMVWAYRVRGEKKKALDEGIFLADTTRHWSGLIHWKHQAFGFSGVCLDPQSGGAGSFIGADLAKTKQIILNVECDNVTPICSRDDTTTGFGQFILMYFRRREEGIAAMWPNLLGDDNLIDAVHMKLQQTVNYGSLLFPKPFNERPREETGEWTTEKKWALKTLDAMRHQLGNIRVETREDGTWALTGHSAKKFTSNGKKDLAYAGLFAYVRFLVWLTLNERDFTAESDGGDGGVYEMQR